MPTNAGPAPSDQDKQLAIQVQRLYRSSATRCAAHDLGPIFAPGKMLIPYLGARIEQKNLIACLRIDNVDFVTLELVAACAYQPQILSRCRPAG
jgi:hypothetical protein